MSENKELYVLARTATLGFQKMKGFCKTRLSLLRSYTSRFYGRPETGAPTPLNLIFQATTTMVPNLVYANPKADIGTRFMQYRPYADIATLALNHLFDEIDLRQTLRETITDSIFMAGFIKTGLGVSGQTVDLEGVLYDVGQPYSKRIDCDDMVLDPVARHWFEQTMCGHKFAIDRERLLESGLFKGKAKETIEKLGSAEDGFRRAKARELSSGGNNLQEAGSLRDMVELVELWLPEREEVVLLPMMGGGEVGQKELRRVSYEGPERGPISMLGFAYVPDNILPIAHAMIWQDLHVMANKIARKSARQAAREKSVLAYEAGSWEDAQAIVDASDGESVRVNQIDGIKEVSYGGAKDDGYKFIEWAKSNFSEMAMNIDLLSGTGSNEPTLGQAEMVQQNVSVRLADMKGIVYNFTSHIAETLFFFLHTDPLIDLPLIKRTRGLDEQVAYTPEMREGDWLDYNVRVKAFSMARQDPNTKVRRLLELAGSVIPAFTQAQQMLGPAFNLENALAMVGNYMGIEELPEIINSQVLQQQQQRMMEALERGVPLDQKVIQTIMGSTGLMQAGSRGTDVVSIDMAGGGAGPGGGRPQQPNPMANIAQGITPDVESNMMHHESEGALQAAGGY